MSFIRGPIKTAAAASAAEQIRGIIDPFPDRPTTNSYLHTEITVAAAAA